MSSISGKFKMKYIKRDKEKNKMSSGETAIDNNDKTGLKISPIDWSGFKQAIDRAENILLISHVRPDGDAIGSQIAMARALKDYGKNVLLINSDPVPPNLAFLDPDHWIQAIGDVSEQNRPPLDSPEDLIMSLDTRAWAQLAKMSEIIKNATCAKIVLDHHVKGDDIGAICFVDPQAEATGSLVRLAIQALGLPMKKEYAFPIFAAVATDTGWFRFSSVNAATYRMIAELIDLGVRPDEVYRLAYEQETFGRTKLVGYALAKAEQFLNGAGIFTSLTLTDFDQSGAIPSESEDIVNLTLQVAETKAAVIMVEQRTGGFKLSFRSRCDLDCSLLAARFGGGGHKKAAGAFIDLPYEEAKTKVLAETSAMLNEALRDRNF